MHCNLCGPSNLAKCTIILYGSTVFDQVVKHPATVSTSRKKKLCKYVNMKNCLCCLTIHGMLYDLTITENICELICIHKTPDS